MSTRSGGHGIHLTTTDSKLPNNAMADEHTFKMQQRNLQLDNQLFDKHKMKTEEITKESKKSGKDAKHRDIKLILKNYVSARIFLTNQFCLEIASIDVSSLSFLYPLENKSET